MTYNQYAVNVERSDTFEKQEQDKNDYVNLLNDKIQVQTIHKNAIELYNYNGNLPHVQPTLISINDQFVNMNQLKADLIKMIQDEGMTDADNATKIVFYIANNFDIRRFYQELDTLIAFIKVKYRIGITFEEFKVFYEQFIQISSDEYATYSNAKDTKDFNDDDRDEDSIVYTTNNKRKLTEIYDDFGVNEVKFDINKQPPSQFETQNAINEEQNVLNYREKHDKMIFPSEKRNKKNTVNKRPRQEISETEQSKKRRMEPNLPSALSKSLKNKGNVLKKNVSLKSGKSSLTNILDNSQETYTKAVMYLDPNTLYTLTKPKLYTIAQNVNKKLETKVKSLSSMNKIELISMIVDNTNFLQPNAEKLEDSGNTVNMNDRIKMPLLRNKIATRPKMKGGSVYSSKPDASWYSSKSYEKFKPFGTKLVDYDKMCNDNCISLHHKCGAKDSSFPVRKVNRLFGKILRSMINGDTPDYTDMNKLSDSDKSYLYCFLKKTRTHGYYSVPVPEKDEEWQEFDKFELLLGQIRAGNNNSDMIRDLKLMLMKFRNSNMMPKNQVNAILYELNDLGY